MSNKKKKYPKQRQVQAQKNRQTLLIILGGVVLLAVALFFTFRKPTTFYTPQVTGMPSLKADREKLDLGSIKLGTPIKVSFELTNVGDQPLTFKEEPYVEAREGC